MNTENLRLSTGNRGYTLVELMVAMAIGIFILGTVVALFVTSKSSYRAQEGFDALQENGRYAIRALADDVRLAGYAGITLDPAIPGSIANNPYSTVTNACTAANWVDLRQPIFGSNASALTGTGSDARTPVSGCIAVAADYKLGTDILVLRHASGQNVTTLAANTIYLHSELSSGSLFVGTTAPAPVSNPSAIHEINVHVYYVRPWAVAVGDGIPTLVRETLVSGPEMVAQPLVEGIENMQISYGVDTTTPGDLVVDRYYPASSLSESTAVSPNWAQVVSVRIELLVRTPLGDGGFGNDTSTYTLGDLPTLAAANDRFRRGVYSTTVMLRNYRRT